MWKLDEGGHRTDTIDRIPSDDCRFQKILDVTFTKLTLSKLTMFNVRISDDDEQTLKQRMR